MEIADIVQSTKKSDWPLRIKNSAISIDDIDYDTTIEVIMYMITIVEEDQELIADSAGVLNSTTLAERAYDIADVPVDEIPEGFFELAHKVVSVFESLQED